MAAMHQRGTDHVLVANQFTQIFGRLGLDLIQVNPDGTATVHARGDAFDRLLASSEQLDALGPREKARWAKIMAAAAALTKLEVEKFLRQLPTGN